MKKALLTLIVVFSFILFSCQVAGTGSEGGTTAVTVDGDIVQDVLIAEDEEFDFATIRSTPFCLEVKNEAGETVENVSVTISKPDGKVIKQVVTQAGKTEFVVFNDEVSGKITLTINHPAYEQRVITVDNFDRIKELIRVLLVKYGVNDYQDADGDNIPDEVDSCDNTDPASEYIYTQGSFKILYEDLYPCRGDMDFNDVVVKLDMIAYDSTKTGMYISKIKLKYQVLASGAGYTDVGFYISAASRNPQHPFKFWATPNGLSTTEAPLVENVKKELLGRNKDLWETVNAKKGSTYAPGQVHEVVLDFEKIYGEPICDLYFPYLPLDPYIVVRHDVQSSNKVDSEFSKYKAGGMNISLDTADAKRYILDGVSYRREVHLPFAHTDFKGMLKDYEGFPWALVVNDGVRWPLLGMDIHKAYDKFSAWYLSGGKTDRDWLYYPSQPKEEFVYVIK